MCQVRADQVAPEKKQLAEAFFNISDSGSGFSSHSVCISPNQHLTPARQRAPQQLAPQQTRYGTIALMNPTRAHNLDLIPIEDGDYEAIRERTELSISLKRVCCGTGTSSLEEQTRLFWQSYGELLQTTPDKCSLQEAVTTLVAAVQHHLLVFNYLQLDGFAPGLLDMATLNAIAVCHHEHQHQQQHKQQHKKARRHVVVVGCKKQICRTDMILLFPKLDQEKMQYPAFVDPQLVVFLREQYEILTNAFQRLNTTVDVCRAPWQFQCRGMHTLSLTSTNGCWCVTDSQAHLGARRHKG